jgi:hypothetical protein
MTDAACGPTFPGLDAGRAERFARVALANVAREWPHKLDHAMAGPTELRLPRELHPVFHGSFDWHSSVHMHWLLARTLRAQPSMPSAAAVTACLDSRLTPAAVAGELAYFEAPQARGFERPYGWAWLLALQAELARGAAEAGADRAAADRSAAFARWREALAPLAGAIVARFEAFLPLAVLPMRVGTHSNTAFALLLALHHAERCDAPALAALCRERALAWHLSDRDWPSAYEPSLDEFLSPGLTVAALMARVLPRDDARGWLARFLPAHDAPSLATWLAPIAPPDRADGKLAHLDGLALSRAWCMRRLLAADVLGSELAARFGAGVRAHLDMGLPQAVGGDYMGEHWLASFAALALDDL